MVDDAKLRKVEDKLLLMVNDLDVIVEDIDKRLRRLERDREDIWKYLKDISVSTKQ